MDRKKFIGASEVASVLGINPFCSPLKLWGIKTGAIEPDEENEAMFWGSRLERTVSGAFAEKHNVKLMAYKKRFVHKTMPYFSCELDNIIVGTEEIVEIKTVNAFDWKKWADPDAIPEYVISQVTAQMGLSGRNKAWVACLCGGQKYIEKFVAFDPDLYEVIENRVRDFWENFVIPKIPPMAVSADGDIIVDIYPQRTEQIQMVQELETEIARLQELKMHEKEIKEEKEAVEIKLKDVIKTNKGIRTEKYLVEWNGFIQARVDTEKLKEAGLYDKYSKELVTRRLTVKLNKGEK